MSYTAIDILVSDTTPGVAPIPGVVVKILSQDGRQSITQGQTDQTGRAQFLLPTGIYQVRLFKFSVAFKAQLIEVLDAPALFAMSGELFIPPTSPDPRLCMASGYFRDVTGAPADGVAIIFIAKFTPVWLEGAAVLTERHEVRTDARGYVQVPLIRCGQFDVTVTGYENYMRQVSVPNLASVNLPDLLFPIVQQITFSPTGPYALTVGTDSEITPTVYASDGRILDGTGTQTGDVQWSSSDPTVFVVIPSVTKLILRPLAPGTAELRAARIDTSVVHIPDGGIVGVPQVVTVT